MKSSRLITFFAITLALALAGCGGQAASPTDGSETASVDPAPVAKTDSELLIGTWTEQSADYQEWMTFTEEGMATIDDGGHSIDLAYEVDEAAHKITLSNDEAALEFEYSFVDDDTVEMTSDGETSTLVRDTSAANIPASVDVQPEYLDVDGGVTVNALQSLTGPEVVALLTQQGYACDGDSWENEATGDKLYVENLKHEGVAERGYAAAEVAGQLAEGYVRIVTKARSLTTTGDLEDVRDAIAQGFSVEQSWVLGGGAHYYSIVADPAGTRYFMVVTANSEDTAIVEFQTDAYLADTDYGSIDGVIEFWNS